MNEGFRNEYEHVTRDSEVVQRSVEIAREETDAYDKNFLFTEESVSKFIDDLDEIEEFRKLDDSPEHLVRYNEVEERKLFLIKRAYGFFIKNSSVAVRTSLLKDVLSDADLKNEVFTEAGGLANVDALAPKTIVRILKLRIERNKERKEALSEGWENIVLNVVSNVKEGIEKGIIKRDIELADKIGNGLKFGTYDTFFTVRNSEGVHNSALQNIEFDLNASIEEIPHIVLHEMIHALSGSTLLRSKTIDEEDKIKEKVKNQKTGLMFMNFDHEGEVNGRKLFWLNEAVTEEITIQLTDDSLMAYESERRKLKRLYELGIDREIIYNAYFEDYNPDDPERVPHWKKFVAELKRVFPDLSVIQALKKVSDDVDKEIEEEKNNEKTQG